MEKSFNGISLQTLKEKQQKQQHSVVKYVPQNLFSSHGQHGMVEKEIDPVLTCPHAAQHIQKHLA